MQKFFDFDNLNKIGVYVSLLLSILTIAYWLISTLASFVRYSRIKNVKSGIYNGYWVDPIKKEINCEILRLKKTVGGIKITPIYKHKAFHDYKVYAKPYSLNQYIIGGRWFGQPNTIYKGYCLFTYNIEDDSFFGKWIGPRSNLNINSGDWIMIYYTNIENSYVKYKSWQKLYTFKERLFPSDSILINIIKKHEIYPISNYKFDNIEMDINKDSFIPTLGKVSIPLIQYVSSIAKATDTILDLGTGTGFYPIYLSKNVGCKVKGVDADDKTITLAKNNSIKNSVQHLVTFDTCSKTELFSSIKTGEKYDLIIANLPFTRVSRSYKSKKSKHYFSFSGTIDLLEQLILGSQYHLKPNGKLIFCYGESGYRELLEAIISISSWGGLKIIKKIEEKDDTFYVMELELSEKVKSFYTKLSKEQSMLTD